MVRPGIRRRAPAERNNALSDRGVGQRHRPLDRNGDPQPAEHLVVEPTAQLRPAEHHHDVVGGDSPGEQRRDLSGHRLSLAALAPAFQERQPAVGLDSRIRHLEQPAVELPERRARRVVRVEGELLDGLGRELVREAGEKPGSGGQCVVVLVVHGDDHLGGGGECAQQVELLLRQVVEAVDEDGPCPPGIRSVAQAARGRRGGRMVVVAPGTISPLPVGGVQAGELGLVLSTVELPCRRREVVGRDQRRLQLG